MPADAPPPRSTRHVVVSRWRHCAAVVKVEDTSTVHVLEEAEPAAGGVGGATDSVPPQTRRIPLLALTLTFAPDESRFMYTTDLQSLGPTVLGVFEGALTAVSFWSVRQAAK